MLLRESGKKVNQTFNLNVVTGAEGQVGLEHESELMDVAEAVFNADHSAIRAVRQRTESVLGSQGLADAIGVAAAFDGITKIANATGLPLDAMTVEPTREMRSATGIDDFSENHKTGLFG